MNKAKIIAIFGSPGSGKSTISALLSKELASSGATILLNGDICTPMLPLFQISQKNIDCCSLGNLLSIPRLDKGVVLKNIVSLGKPDDLGILAFNNGDNEDAYPKYDWQRARDLISYLSNLCQYLIVDCQSRFEDPFTTAALTAADTVISVSGGTPKDYSFIESQYSRDCMREIMKASIHCENNAATITVNSSPKEQGILYRFSYDKRIPRAWSTGEIFQIHLKYSFRKSITQLGKQLRQEGI